MPKWSEKEEELLKKYYPTRGGKYVAKRLGKTYNAVAIRARKLNLKAEEKWKQWQLNYVKKNCMIKPAASIARSIHKDIRAVRGKMHEFGFVTIINKWTDEQIEMVRVFYPDGAITHKQMEEATGHSWESIRKKAGELKLQRNNNYSREDDLFLKKNFREMTNQELGKILGRSAFGVRERLHALNSKRFTVKHWTETDDQFMSENYFNMKQIDIAKILNTTVFAVKARAKVLKLKKGQCVKWTDEESLYLMENYLILPLSEMAAHLGKNKKSIQNMALKLISPEEREQRLKTARNKS
jgi:hypothetical protein